MPFFWNHEALKGARRAQLTVSLLILSLLTTLTRENKQSLYLISHCLYIFKQLLHRIIQT